MNVALRSHTSVTSKTYEHTILIVDDNPTNLGVLSDYLRDSGFRILVARSGESALKKVKYATPDLILLDVMMPGLNGFETCRRLKADETTKEIPVIFMTALAEPEDKVEGFRVGGVDYVIKPLHHAEVLARVTTHLRLRDLTKDLQEQNLQLQRTTVQLETSSQVAKQATSILELDELLERVVQLIQSQFVYYFVGIWLPNRLQDALVLQTYAAPTATGAIPKATANQRPAVHVPIEMENSIVAWVFRQGEQYVAEDVSLDPTYLALDNLPDTQSELALPLHIGSEMIGILDIQSNQLAAFGAEDKIVLQTLADQIAIAIRNAHLYKREQGRRQLSESLEQTGRVLSGSLDLHQTPGRILQLLADVVPYERGAVMLQYDQELRSIAQRGFPDDDRVKELQVPIREGDVFDQMLSTRQPIVVDDVTAEAGWQQVIWLPVDHSWLGVPLISKYRVMGMISLTRREVAAFTSDDVTLVLSFASQAAVALENANLYAEISRLNEDLEQKVAQRTQELNEAYQVLERLNKAKTDFIDVTSHELRTPLSVIRGYTQVLGIMPAITHNAEIKDLLDGIVNGVDRLHQIVNLMLDVVKIDTAALNIHPEPTPIEVVINEVVARLTKALQERELTLTVEPLELLPPLEIDPDLMNKVFNQLITNAIKYTPDGGSITISGRLISAKASQPMVELVIQDTGIGIHPSHHEQIFEKFYQTGSVALHSTGQTKFKGGGPGLGLAIVRGIVSAHGGRVWVESSGHDEENYPGSQFYIQLPVKQP